jgi:hypothetical protein
MPGKPGLGILECKHYDSAKEQLAQHCVHGVKLILAIIHD